MKHPRFAHLATDVLANEPIAPQAPSVDAEERAVNAIAGAIRARARRRRRLRLAGAAAIAAAVVLAVGYSARMRSMDPPSPAAASSHGSQAALAVARLVDVGPGAVVVRNGANLPLAASALIQPGDRLVPAASDALAFKLADGSEVILEPGSDVTIASLAAARRLRLVRGALRAHVTKLAPGEQFIVNTPDAEVEVRGTAFRVALAPEAEVPPGCSQARTRVTVLEGVVVVRWRGTEERVSGGSAWAPPCAGAPSAGTASIPPDATVSRGSGSASRTSHAPPSVVTPPSASSSSHPVPEPNHGLAEQNRLFAEATEARRSGNAAAAVNAYERLLLRHPDSVLVESAMVERMRTLDTMDRARARTAAVDYIARYPKGYARSEADRLLAR